MAGCEGWKQVLYVAPSDRTVLERLIANGKTPQKLAVRARIVLLSGRGLGTMAIARETRVSKPTIWRWQEAYMEGGVERLRKDKGKGPKAGKPRISDAVRLRIVTMTAKEKPANATHWSSRMLAKQVGVGHTTVQRVWKEYGLKPRLTRSFKLSNDPQFAEKVRDIVGRYYTSRTFFGGGAKCAPLTWNSGLTALERHRRQISERRAPAPWIVKPSMKANTARRASACVLKRHRSSSSHSSVAKKLSAIALSQASPTEPIEGRTPASRQRLPKAMDVYCEP